MASATPSPQRLFRSRTEPIRHGLDWNHLWSGDDRGLIASWEAGRGMAEKQPELASAARRGELVTLPWKGGVDAEELAATAARRAERERRTGKKSKTKPRQRFGPLLYLAMWQGLRGEDLDITLMGDTRLTCTATGVAVVFTSEVARYAEPELREEVVAHTPPDGRAGEPIPPLEQERADER